MIALYIILGIIIWSFMGTLTIKMFIKAFKINTHSEEAALLAFVFIIWPIMIPCLAMYILFTVFAKWLKIDV